MAGQVLAEYFWRSPEFTCDGTQHNTSFALNYQATMYVKKVLIDILHSSVGQSGLIALSYDSPDPNGQYQLCVVEENELKGEEDFGENAVQVPAGQALALEWNGNGGGTRQFNITIFYSANP